MNWRCIFDTDLHDSNNLKIGQRLGIPFTRSLQEKIVVKLPSTTDRDRSVALYQDGGGVVAISGVVWDCALHFVDYILSNYESIGADRYRNVLDLGCGTGICGIMLLELFPTLDQLMLTDKVETDALEKNLEDLSMRSHQLYSKTVFQEFKWDINSMPAQITAPGWDLIICSDLLYDAKCHGSLLECLRVLKTKEIIFAYKVRHAETEKEFFEMLSTTHEITVVNNSTIHSVNLTAEQVSALYIVKAIPR